MPTHNISKETVGKLTLVKLQFLVIKKPLKNLTICQIKQWRNTVWALTDSL